jgi:NAD(P)-dependent dehydrogenase (short-subunit alcohol dehydrogenase family)
VLEGKVALVTGASRGGGKGIALVLGARGAIVYVTGRSVRGEPTTLGRPGTIDETAEELAVRGGTGIAVRCDHTDDAQVEALFDRIRREQGRLDLLVNNAWSGYEISPDPSLGRTRDRSAGRGRERARELGPRLHDARARPRVRLHRRGRQTAIRVLGRACGRHLGRLTGGYTA